MNRSFKTFTALGVTILSLIACGGLENAKVIQSTPEITPAPTAVATDALVSPTKQPEIIKNFSEYDVQDSINYIHKEIAFDGAGIYNSLSEYPKNFFAKFVGHAANIIIARAGLNVSADDIAANTQKTNNEGMYQLYKTDQQKNNYPDSEIPPVNVTYGRTTFNDDGTKTISINEDANDFSNKYLKEHAVLIEGKQILKIDFHQNYLAMLFDVATHEPFHFSTGYQKINPESFTNLSSGNTFTFDQKFGLGLTGHKNNEPQHTFFGAIDEWAINYASTSLTADLNIFRPLNYSSTFKPVSEIFANFDYKSPKDIVKLQQKDGLIELINRIAKYQEAGGMDKENARNKAFTACVLLGNLLNDVNAPLELYESLQNYMLDSKQIDPPFSY